MLQRRTVAFRLNGAPVTLGPAVSPAETLLRWLRGPAGLTGTKEGCAEGDCGACTVVLEQPGGARLPINACLVAMGQLDGASIRTVEGLGGDHALQLAMAQGNATQCGFCTPGFVMAAWAHEAEGGDVHEALAGNLCRCTGYRPIVDALACERSPSPDLPSMPAPEAASFAAACCTFHRPTTLAELLALRAAHPTAWLLGGGTDLGLLLAEARDRPETIIHTAGVAGLQRLDTTPAGLSVGASVTYARLLQAVRTAPAFAPMAPLLARLGSRQIRSLGTLGGNLGTASPIGDMLPPLLALDATVRLVSARGVRDMPVAAFLLGYRRHALASDEVIERILVPPPPPGTLFVCEKISKRYDQDIATVSAAFVVRLDAGAVVEARLAYGGMGPIAARAAQAERALLGPWSQTALARAAEALDRDFAPLSDLRSTARYRRQVAASLLAKLWWRTNDPSLPSGIFDVQVA